MDSFLEPGQQASLASIVAKLQELDSDIGALRSEVAESAGARKEGRSGESGDVVSDTSVTWLREGQEAINQQVLSYERLNQLIVERIELERSAAQATRNTALAADGESSGGGVFTRGKNKVKTLFSGGGSASDEQATRGMDEQGAALTGVTQKTEQAAITARELGVSEQELAENLQYATMAMVDSSDAMTAHGAMSTEFLSALARGQVGLQDLGEQVGQTVGKFGAWTLAAAGVYGALDAVMQLKDGAVATNSAIEGLTKYIPNLNKGQARNQIIQQATETATPISDVGDTAQQFAKAIHNQTQAFAATHIALSAAKLDTISLADSYQYLIAIMQEGSLSVSQLSGVFDQLTGAQDRGGARISQLLPAVAKSMAAVTIGGGNVNQLIALEALAVKRGGVTGSTVATAFQRGATNPNLGFTSPGSQGILAADFGVKPGTGMTEAMLQVLDKIGHGDLPQGMSEDTAKKVAAGAFFGKSFGGRMAALFNPSPEQVTKMLKDTSPESTKGLANEQLEKTVGQAGNQLKLLGINLQAIGAEIGGAGLAQPITALIGTFDALLVTTRDLLSAWDTLPGPVKDLAADMLTLKLVMAGVRRLGVGDIMEARNGPVSGGLAPLFKRDESKAANSDITKYAAAGVNQAESDASRAGARNMAAQQHLITATERRAAELDAAGGDEDAMAAAESKYDAAVTKAAEALAEQQITSEILAEKQRQLAGYRSDYGSNKTRGGWREGFSRTGMSAQEAAERNGLGVYASKTGAPAAGTAASRAAAASTDELSEADARLAVAQERMSIATTRLAETQSAAAGTALVEARGELTAAEAASVEAAAQERLAVATVESSGILATAAEGMASLGLAAGELVGVLMGPLMAAFGAFEGLKYLSAADTSGQNRTRKAITHSTTAAGADAAYNRSLTGGIPGLSLGNAIGGEDQSAAMELKGQLGYIKSVGTAQAAAAKSLNEMNDWVRRAGQAAGGSKQQIQDLQTALNELATNKALSGTDPEAFKVVSTNLQNSLNKAQNPGGKGANPFAEFQNQTVTQLEATLKGYGEMGQVYGVGHQDVSKKLSLGYAQAVAQLGNSNDTGNMEALTEAKSSYDSALSQSLSDMETAAKNSTSQGGAERDYSGAISTIEADLRNNTTSFHKKIVDAGNNTGVVKRLEQAWNEENLSQKADLQTLIQDLIQQTASYDQMVSSQDTDVGPAADLERAQKTLTGDLSQLKQGKSDPHTGTQELQTLQTQYNQQVATVLQDKVNAIEQLVQSQSQLAQSGEADPIAQAQTAISFAKEEIARLRSAGDSDPTEINQLLATIQQSQVQLVQQILANWQTSQQTILTQEDTGKNEMVQANNAVANAQANLAHVLALGNAVPKSTVLQAYQTLAQAQESQAQEALQEGQSLIQAQSALAQSGTTNPVTIAQYALAGDEKLLKYMVAHHFTMSQIVQQQAQVGNDIKGLEEAKYTLSEQTTEFQASTYQITGAQEIQQLEKTYEQMKKAHASITALQQIYQQIWNLEYGNSGDLNLNAGAMHLPSTYEVKSAIQAGNLAARKKNAQGVFADVKTNVTMSVVINKDTDIKKFSNALNKALGTSVNGLAQAAGLV